MPCRIFMLAPTGFYADYGCHVRIRGHATALQQRGHEVLLYTYPYGRDVPELSIMRPGLWSRRSDFSVGATWRKVLLDATLWPGAWRAARRWRPHVIHAYLHEGALIGAFLARRLRIPLVFDYQGSLTEELLTHGFIGQRSPTLPLWRALEHWIDRMPDTILASSRAAVQRLQSKKGLRAHTTYLPDSAEPTRFSTAQPEEDTVALRHRLHISASRPVVVYLGLLAPYQGIDVLLQAAAQLHGDGFAPQPYYLVMGFPHLERYQRLTTELGIADVVRFTGAIPYTQAPLYLALGDVAVAPKLATSEGSGKVLTYMAAGLPIVASDTPVHREYLGNDGYYAAAGSPEALAQALHNALHDPERVARGRRLQQRAAAHYTWRHAAMQIEHAYRQVGVAGGAFAVAKLAML